MGLPVKGFTLFIVDILKLDLDFLLILGETDEVEAFSHLVEEHVVLAYVLGSLHPSLLLIFYPLLEVKQLELIITAELAIPSVMVSRDAINQHLPL